jgi:hypothetical protein
VSPYEAAYNVGLKLPGTFMSYAAIMAVFGETTIAIHAGLILINLATAVLVWVLARRMFGNAAGVVAAGTYALLSIDPASFGLAAHGTHFIMLPAIAGIVLLQNLDDKTSMRRIFSAGLLLGLAVIMKQTGAAFGLFAVVWVVSCELGSGNRHWNRLFVRLGWLVLGVLLPFILTCLLVASEGEFGRFWFWAFQYAGAHGTVVGVGTGLKWMLISLGMQFASAPGLWSAAILGLCALFYDRSSHWRFFIVSFLLFSFLAVCPGWYFREHYFIQMFPAASLLAAAAFDAASDFVTRHHSTFMRLAPSLIFAAVVTSALIQWRDVYFFLKPAEASRAIYGAKPFPEAVEVGRYLALHCPPNARIAVIGSEPEIFFYSHRRSATGYICTYPLMEAEPYAVEMQKEMIQQIEKTDPEFVVFVHFSDSWARNAHSNPLIFDWFGRYQREHLRLAGLVETHPGEPTQYLWYDQSAKVDDDANLAMALRQQQPLLAIFKGHADDARSKGN